MLRILARQDAAKQQQQQAEPEAHIASSDPEIKYLRINAARLLKACEAMVAAAAPDKLDMETLATV